MATVSIQEFLAQANRGLNQNVLGPEYLTKALARRMRFSRPRLLIISLQPLTVVKCGNHSTTKPDSSTQSPELRSVTKLVGGSGRIAEHSDLVQ